MFPHDYLVILIFHMCCLRDGSLVRRVTSPKGVEWRFREHNGQKFSCQFMYS